MDSLIKKSEWCLSHDYWSQVDEGINGEFQIAFKKKPEWDTPKQEIAQK